MQLNGNRDFKLWFVNQMNLIMNDSIYTKHYGLRQGFLNFFRSAESCYVHKIFADGCYTFFKSCYVATLFEKSCYTATMNVATNVATKMLL